MDPTSAPLVALNERTIPSVSSFTLSDTLTEVILLTHGPCATPRPRQMAFGELEDKVPRMPDEAPAGLEQLLLKACQ